MVLDAVSNFVRGNTDAAVGTDDTTVSVADASIFPDPETDGEFNVVIWDVNNFPRPDQDGDVEIVRVTARDTTADELSVVRGQETTSAAIHPEGSAIHLSPTAKMFSDIESTFGDFWDAGTQELTADVNNTNTTTTSLEAEDAHTKVINGMVVADHPDFDRLAEAYQFAVDNGLSAMYIPNGDYEFRGNLQEPIDWIGQSRKGVFIERGSSDDDLDSIAATGEFIRGIGGANVTMCNFTFDSDGNEIRLDDGNNLKIKNVQGDQITVRSDNCIVTGNFVESIFDGGSGTLPQPLDEYNQLI